MCPHEPPVSPPTDQGAWRVLAWIRSVAGVAQVCDPAAWAADRLATGVELLHLARGSDSGQQPAPATRGGGSPGGVPPAASAAARRLAERGLPAPELCLAQGRPLDAIRRLSRGADLLVVARPRRGAGAPPRLSAVIRVSRAPVLVAGERFSPFRAAQVIDDPARPDPAFADRVLVNPLLDGLVVQRMDFHDAAAAAPGLVRGSALAAGGSGKRNAAAEVIVLPGAALGPTSAQAPLRRLIQALMGAPRALLFC